MTLSHITVTQYMTYSSARKLALGGENSQTQLDSALSHYKKLRGQFFKPNAHTGQAGDWFDILRELEHDVQGNTPRGYHESNKHRTISFYGVNTQFTPMALNLKIPFLIEDDNDQINEPVRISSFLGREPSQADCKEFHRIKAEKIRTLCNSSDCPHIKRPEVSEGDNGC